MTIRDTSEGYGIVTRLLHWSMALAVVAMFVLGWWMVGLDYYSPYYRSAPDLHRSVGIVLLVALALRFGWRTANVRPDDRVLTPRERAVSHIVHVAFYPLLLAVMVSGYLISTVDGRPIDVFGLFSVPSLIQSKGLEDAAGFAHEWLAYLTIALATLHSAAALKHHFVDKSNILTRMWTGPSTTPSSPTERMRHP